jgi:GNAT superfamily N-acetyltransferase
MQVRTYEEVDPYEVYKLTMVTFRWPLTPKYVRHFLRRDPRRCDGYALYAVEHGRPVAQVVPLRMPVRLTNGVEGVGGVAGVCSLPSVWGRGFARGRIERAHDIYRELGLRITTLTTSRNIRGYGIYRKMGYVDLGDFFQASRTLPSGGRGRGGLRVRRASPRDLPEIQASFERYTADLLGWTERDPRLLEAREKRGYAVVRGITCARDRKRYGSIGYDINGPRLSVAMAIPLKRSARARDLPRLFGVPQGRFVLYPTDWF